MNRRRFLQVAAASVATACGTLAQPAAQAAVESAAKMKVILWCWDARMTWDDEPNAISRAMAASERPFPYVKRAESFLVGFKRLIDYCATTGIHGVVIWGFLRDAHGGVAAAKELCSYAADRGVSILPGVGLCAYGGYYFEGDHRFNLQTYLREHPDRVSKAAEERGGREVTPVLDPSLEANQTWWKDGLEWMLETFQVAGFDYEMGDFMVNSSPGAVQARAAMGFEADGNIMDAVVATQDLMQRAYALRPDGIFINCTYRGFHQLRGFPAAAYVQATHPKTVWEYTLAGMVRDPRFPDGFKGMTPHRKYGYLHWFNSSTKTMDRDYTADIARVFAGLRALDFEFAGTYGEISARDNPVADGNYRAQVAAACGPHGVVR